MIVECLHCGKEFKTFPCRLKTGEGKYCSNQCYHAHGGPQPYSGKSYKHVAIDSTRARKLHIVLAEKALGRKLPDKAVVHHANGGFDGPLVICENTAYHGLLHVRTRAFKATGDPNKRKCTYCKAYDDLATLTANGRNFYHKDCRNEYRREATNVCRKNIGT